MFYCQSTTPMVRGGTSNSPHACRSISRTGRCNMAVGAREEKQPSQIGNTLASNLGEPLPSCSSRCPSLDYVEQPSVLTGEREPDQ